MAGVAYATPFPSSPTTARAKTSRLKAKKWMPWAVRPARASHRPTAPGPLRPGSSPHRPAPGLVPAIICAIICATICASPNCRGGGRPFVAKLPVLADLSLATFSCLSRTYLGVGILEMPSAVPITQMLHLPPRPVSVARGAGTKGPVCPHQSPVAQGGRAVDNGVSGEPDRYGRGCASGRGPVPARTGCNRNGGIRWCPG